MIFDGHGDVWTDVTCKHVDKGEHDVFRKYHLDKFRKGNVTGGIFVIWMDPPYDQDPVKRSRQIVQSIRQEQEESRDIVNYVTKFSDFDEGTKAGKINVVTGMEGMAQIGEDIDLIDYFYHEVGVRHAMMTWNETNALATGWPGDVSRGLTETGRRACRRIQDLGMVMDVSHLNDKCFWDVIHLAQGPIIASHSNSRTVCPHMRNLSDDMLRAIAETGGLAGMNSMREFIAEAHDDQTVERLADHVCYIADLIGVEHIGLGFDFDDYLESDALSAFSGNIDSPSGLGIANEAEASNLLDVLRQRGFHQDELDAIGYKNFYRVFKQVWK